MREHNLCEAEYEKLPDAKDGSHPDTTCEKSGQSPIVGFRYCWDEAWDKQHNLCEAEYEKLPDDEKTKYEKIAPPNTKACYEKIAPFTSKVLQDIEETIAAGNRDFERVYRAVWAVLQSGEEHLWPRFKVAVGALLECIKRPDDKPSQREEAKQPTTLLADAAHTKPSFEVVVEGLVTLGDGTRLEMQRVGDVDKHGDETSGLKKLQRVVEKALLKPASDATVGETDSVLDVVRAMIVVKDFGVIAAIVEGLKALSDAELVEVLRLKNRFESPSAGGWRDLMINVVIVGDARQHVCEIQIVHEMMLTARKGLPGVRAAASTPACVPSPRHNRCAASTRPSPVSLSLSPVRSHVRRHLCVLLSVMRSTRCTPRCARRPSWSSGSARSASCGARRWPSCAPAGRATRR